MKPLNTEAIDMISIGLRARLMPQCGLTAVNDTRGAH